MDRRSFLCVVASLASGARHAAWSTPLSPVEVRGAYGDPSDFWKTGARLDDIGVDAVFVPAGSVNEHMVARIRSEGARVFVDFPTFNGGRWLLGRVGEKEEPIREHLDAWPMDAAGKRSPKLDWFLGICPTNRAFLEDRFETLARIVDRFEPDGVWLDYLHWHAQFESPKPGLPETCFSESCVRQFERDTGVETRGEKPREWAGDILTRHEGRWRDWRCDWLARFVRDCREIVSAGSSTRLLGSFQCPWRDDEHDGARRRILGLDLDLLAPEIDVMSPMLYHGRLDRDPRTWVTENVRWLTERLGTAGETAPRVWPIVQAFDRPRAVTATELENALRGARRGGATGVLFLSLSSMAASEAKTAVVRELYRNVLSGS